MAVLEVKNLTKRFGDFTAVDRISFEVQEGEIFGFLGPNGAGKSTSIKMLTTTLNPTSGEARLCGYDIVRQRDDVRRNLGIVFQDSATDKFLTGRDNLNYHGVMYHMSKREREQRIDEVLDLLDLRGKENIPIKGCSGGIQRRFEVARGFTTRPKLLFLDEPTIGLDIQARKTLWDYINKLRENEGVTILLTTHYIEEADHLCDRVSIIDHGQIAAIDAPQKLKGVVGTDLVRVEIADGQGKDFVRAFNGLDWVKNIDQDGTVFKLSVEGGEKKAHEILSIASQHSIPVTSVEVFEPSLEDAFLQFTGKTIREEEGSIQDFKKAMRRKGR